MRLKKKNEGKISNTYLVPSDLQDLHCYPIPGILTEAPSKLASQGWTVVGLRQPGRVCFIETPLKLVVWFSLAGTRISSAPQRWWPNPLASRARINSPSTQGVWHWGPQLKPPS